MQKPIIKTTCPYCGVGCGVDAVVEKANAHVVTINGDQSHPANYGRLCSKGSALADTVGLQGRLLHPEIQGQKTSWDQALDAVADGFSRIVREHGPDAVAFYVSGQLLTEDYYVANKLMKGFIGSANIDTNSRLCMSSAVVGYKRAFGADAVPGNYEDLELADLLVLVGSNAAWCHPVAFQRIRQAKERRPELKIVVIDPRRTDSCDLADLHLPLAPGSDVRLFNGLLAFLADRDLLDHDFIEQHCEGFEQTLTTACKDAEDIASVAAHCGLDQDDLLKFYRWFADNPQTVTLFSQGVNQSSSGSDKCNAIINCHLASGRVGKPGMAPFSLTGQPNAMGGREVGGLANMLAAHMDLDKPEHVDRVGRFWQSENMAHSQGLRAVELFDAIAAGKVKAIWIMATNPVVSLPNADHVKQALSHCELVVVSDCIADTDTTEWADIKLPATGWSEKDGTVTNCERRISRQRALFNPGGEARPDWWIISEVAKRMGYASAFNYASTADIFREHAALSAFENDSKHGVRDFNLQGLTRLSDSEYDDLQPVQWPVLNACRQGTARLFTDGRFYTDSGRARFVAVQWKAPGNLPSVDYPLILNTGRIRDQWHTMTRTGLSPRLNQHKPEPFIEVHPEDSLQAQIKDGGLAQVESLWGSMLGRVNVTDAQQSGSVFVPMHWTAQTSSKGRVGAVVNPVFDPASGQPESKHTPVKVTSFEAQHYLFILSRSPLQLPAMDYRVTVQGKGYLLYQMASLEKYADLADWAKELLSWQGECGSILEYRDDAKGVYRAAQLLDERLQACIFIADHWRLPDTGWIQTLFARDTLTPAQRFALLSAQPPAGQADVGRTVCSCFSVGEKTILAAIREQKLTTVAAIGECLGAGTGCGSCLPELKQLLVQ